MKALKLYQNISFKRLVKTTMRYYVCMRFGKPHFHTENYVETRLNNYNKLVFPGSLSGSAALNNIVRSFVGTLANIQETQNNENDRNHFNNRCPEHDIPPPTIVCSGSLCPFYSHSTLLFFALPGTGKDH
jgi:hypothetical protein